MRLFLLPMFATGDFVEVVRGHRTGLNGIVQIDRRGRAIIQPVYVDGDLLRPVGRTIRVDNTTLAQVPTPTDLRRERRRLREEYLKTLRPVRGERHGNIREYPASVFGPVEYAACR
jgi:hypothetical protein